jgi:hypothetical protein
MIVTTKTTVHFELPKEYQQALDFGKTHKHWRRKTDQTIWVIYTFEQISSVEMKGEEDDDDTN